MTVDEALASWKVAHLNAIRILSAIPPRDRDILVLAMTGDSVADIAAMSGLSPMSVYRSLRRARRAWVRCLLAC
ncbi:sigma factor-like helix-turn-helix DNA-binding protein [Nocardia sp. NPDC003482]